MSLLARHQGHQGHQGHHGHHGHHGHQDITSIFRDIKYFPSAKSQIAKTKRFLFLRNIINEFLKPDDATIPEEIKKVIVEKYAELLVQSIRTEQPIGIILKKMMKELSLFPKKIETLTTLSTYYISEWLSRISGWLSVQTRPEIDKKRIQFMQKSLQSQTSSPTTWIQMLKKINETEQLRFTANSSKIQVMQKLFQEMKREIKAMKKFADAIKKGSTPSRLQQLIAGDLGRFITSFLPPKSSLYDVSSTTRQHMIKTTQSMDLSNNPNWKTDIFDLFIHKQKLPLKKLILSNNRINEEGCTELARALPLLQKLQTLDLSDNIIGNEGCTALASALPQLQKLQTLDLSNNSGFEMHHKKRKKIPR